MRLVLDGVVVRGAGWDARCETVLENAGAYVVVVRSVVPGKAVTFVSCYMAPLAGGIAATHMALALDRAPAFTHRRLTPVPAASQARAWLLDHVAELRELVEDLAGEGVRVEVDERALARAAGVWGDKPLGGEDGGVDRACSR